MKALRDLTVEDLARCPIWRYEGQSDQTASVSPVATFAEPDREAYIARTRFGQQGRPDLAHAGFTQPECELVTPHRPHLPGPR